MDLKSKVTKWHEAMCLLAEGQYHEAASKLLEVENPSAKIYHDIGCICMLNKNFHQAIQHFSTAIDVDKYLAISFCLRGVCYYSIRRFDQAELDFHTAQSLVPNDGIDYRQLGANINIAPRMIDECLTITRNALRTQNQGDLLTFSITACVFYPPKKMVDNLVKQDFLGKAKVISSVQEKDILYGTEKNLQLSAHGKSQSASVPCSPTAPRRQAGAGEGSTVFIPPPPRQPPPRLPQQKSKSTDNLSDYGYERVEESFLVGNSCTDSMSSARNNSAPNSNSGESCAKPIIQVKSDVLKSLMSHNKLFPQTTQSGYRPTQKPNVSADVNRGLPEERKTSTPKPSVLDRAHPSLFGAVNPACSVGIGQTHTVQSKSSTPTEKHNATHTKVATHTQVIPRGERTNLVEQVKSVGQKSPKPPRPPPPKFSK